MKPLLPRILKRLGLLNHLHLTQVISIEEKTVRIPLIHGVGYNHLFGGAEKWMRPLLRRLLDLRKGAFYDVGVNTGQTLIVLKSLDPDRPYVGFEPNPACVSYTKELIRANRFENTELLPVGLSHTTASRTLNLYSDSDVDSSASVIADFRPDQSVARDIRVSVSAFNDLRKNLPEAAIVKIDVEGAEEEVLAGLRETLREQRPIVVCEILPAYSEENTARICKQQNIEKLLREVDYTLHRVRKSPDESEYLGFETLAEIGIHDDLAACDYLFVPREEAEEFAARCQIHG